MQEMKDLAASSARLLSFLHGNPGPDRHRSRCQRGHGQPRAQLQAGRERGHHAQAVITALDVLGYERPAQLRQRSAGLVGLVVPELENPIFPAFAQVIEDALARRRFTPVLCTQSPGSLSEDEYVESLLDHGVAGIIFVSGKHADTRADHDRYRVLLERGLPVVFINGFVEGVDAPFISADDRVAMDLAVAHLFHLGHRRSASPSGRRASCPRPASTRASSPRWAATWASPTTRRAAGSRRRSSPSRAGRRGHRPAARPGGHGRRVRLRHDGDRRDPGRPRPRPVGARRRVGHRLRRLAARGLPRPAAHHRAPAGRADGAHGRRGAGRRDRRATRSPRGSTCSRPSWCCGPPPGRPRADVVRLGRGSDEGRAGEQCRSGR